MSDLPPPPAATVSNSLPRFRGLHKPLQITSGILVALSGFQLYSLISRMILIERVFASPSSVSENDLAAADQAVSSANGLLLVALLVFFVMFLVWIYRTTRFLDDNFAPAEKSPGWAVGSAFIPIANFFLVFSTIKDLGVKLSRFFPELTNGGYRDLHRYWILIVTGNLVAQLSSVLFSEEDDFVLQSYRNSEYLVIAGVLIVGSAHYFAFRAYRNLDIHTSPRVA